MRNYPSNTSSSLQDSTADDEIINKTVNNEIGDFIFTKQNVYKKIKIVGAGKVFIRFYKNNYPILETEIVNTDTTEKNYSIICNKIEVASYDTVDVEITNTNNEITNISSLQNKDLAIEYSFFDDTRGKPTSATFSFTWLRFLNLTNEFQRFLFDKADFYEIRVRYGDRRAEFADRRYWSVFRKFSDFKDRTEITVGQVDFNIFIDYSFSATSKSYVMKFEDTHLNFGNNLYGAIFGIEIRKIQ